MCEIIGEQAMAAKLRETQMMTLLLEEGDKFNAFFNKQLTVWDKVVRDNNIKASGG